MTGMSPGFRKLFHEYAGGALEKQSHLGDLLGNREWQLDLPGGRIHFGEDLEFSAQILGTVSPAKKWTWAWSGVISGIPPHLLKACLAIHQRGTDDDVPELVDPDVPIDGELDANHLAMVANGVYDGDAYFRCPHGQGSIFVLIKDPDFLRMSACDPVRMKAVLQQLLMNFELEPRLALEGYFRYHKIELEEDGARLIGHLKGGGKVLVEFGADGKLARFDSVAQTVQGAAMKLSLQR